MNTICHKPRFLYGIRKVDPQLTDDLECNAYVKHHKENDYHNLRSSIQISVASAHIYFQPCYLGTEVMKGSIITRTSFVPVCRDERTG
jgi:hypothetical protein